MAHNPHVTTSPDDSATYMRVGYTLLFGLLISIAVMLAGLVYGATQGKTASANVLSLSEVLPQLRKENPSALLDLGILLLFATPLVAVLVALTEFLRWGDRTFALITGVLVVLLVAGFVVALN